MIKVTNLSKSRGLFSFLNSASLLFAAMIVSVGTLWALERGAKDFQVFYAAWSHVLSGHGNLIFASSPDRFLYAPGFAFLFSPLALLPLKAAIILWCFLKAGVVGFLIHEFSKLIRGGSLKSDASALAISALGIVFCARPFLIDFQYGQVNTFILGACVWAMTGHLKKTTAQSDYLRWSLLGIAAIAKVFPLPLLAVPFFWTAGISKEKIKRERIGVLLGVILILVLPFLFEGAHGGAHLYDEWKQSLISRGMPIESHNQSFTAFLFHYLSGHATPVIAQGQSLFMGQKLLSLSAISQLSLGWTLIASGFLLALITVPVNGSPLRRTAVLVSGLIIPSHLVWKPYFVMTFPVAVLFLKDAVEGRSKIAKWCIAIALAGLLNLTGFDLLGYKWGAFFEAASVFLWVHLLLMLLVWRDGHAA